MYKKIILSFFYTLFLLFHIIALSAKTLKIATWNVEWLISQEDIKNTPIPNDITLRKPTDFKLLLQYTQKLNADIIALQEVGSLETLNAIFPKNQYLFFISKDFIAQHTTLAIRKNTVEHIQNNSDFTELSKINTSHPLRSGLDITIYTKQNSLRILVLHLKSGCQDYPLDHIKLKEPCILLKKQFSLLQQWIYKRLAEKQAFIILGDFNRVISVHDLLFKELYNTSILTFPTSNKANPCWNGSYFIDGFILDPNAAKWIIPDTLRVMKYTEQDHDKQNTLSDHCPVSIKLLIP